MSHFKWLRMVYDFIAADEMMHKMGVDPIQFHLLFLLYHKKDALSTTAQLERFKHSVMMHEGADAIKKRIDALEQKGLIENLNGVEANAYNADRLVVTPHFEAILIKENAGDELWNAYPAVMPIGDTGSFVSRFGDKDAITMDYERRIRKDVVKHKMVMEQLEKFKRLVVAGKMNGMKIANFVSSELWDVLVEIKENEVTKLADYARDI